jgi:curved DNA-binding protein CbpA
MASKSSVNFYDVLNVDTDATRKDIKAAYKPLVKKYHPDRSTGDTEMFELISKAYTILSNPESREEYDREYKLIKQSESDHKSLKEEAKEYYDAQDTGITKKTKEESKKDYDDLFSEMDKKHKYKRGDNDDVLDEKDAKRRMSDLTMAREQEDIDMIQDPIINPGNFNLADFNARFDAVHGSMTDMVPHTGNPSAWNGPCGVGGMETNYSSLGDYGDLYVEGGEDSTNIGVDGQRFSSVNFHNGPKKKLSAEELKKIKPANYTTGHSTVDKDYNKSLEDKIRERNIETKKYDDREVGDYDTDNTCGGYSIFKEMGMPNGPSIDWDNDDGLKDKYSKLIELRKKDVE